MAAILFSTVSFNLRDPNKNGRLHTTQRIKSHNETK